MMSPDEAALEAIRLNLRLTPEQRLRKMDRARRVTEPHDRSAAGLPRYEGGDHPPIVSTRSIQTPYGEQDENGTDLSLIRSIMQLTPAERLRNADRARRSALRNIEHARRNSKSAGTVS